MYFKLDSIVWETYDLSLSDLKIQDSSLKIHRFWDPLNIDGPQCCYPQLVQCWLARPSSTVLYLKDYTVPVSVAYYALSVSTDICTSKIIS